MLTLCLLLCVVLRVSAGVCLPTVQASTWDPVSGKCLMVATERRNDVFVLLFCCGLSLEL